MAIIGIEVRGLDTVFNNINKTMVESVNAGKQSMDKMGDDILRDAKADCPVSQPPVRPTVRHGALRDSGRKFTTSLGLETSLTEIHFGSDAVFYALYVHEDLTKHHPIGKAKFLEDAFNKHMSGFLYRIAGDIGRSLG